MSIASIDIGSNTVRVLVAQVDECRIVPLWQGQAITRLARGLSASGQMGRQEMDETVEVLKSYKKIAKGFAVSKIVAAGTAALREAENAMEFIRLVREQTGIVVEILKGHTEAGLMAYGVTNSLPEANNALILDIGGASTEVVAVQGGKVLSHQTVGVGVVKLLERYVASDPPARSELNSLEEESRRVGNGFSANTRAYVDTETIFVSTAGTPTTLAAIDLGLENYDHQRVHGHRLSLKRLEEMLLKFAAVPADERVRMGCLDPKRADLIIPGLSLTIGIMKSFGFHEMTVSDHGLLEGLLLRSAGCGH